MATPAALARPGASAAPGSVPAWRVSEAGAAREGAARQCWKVGVNTLFRRPVFDDTDAARAVARLHRVPGAWCGSDCLAWVLLPDRWQALIAIAPGDALERILTRFKTASARVVDPRLRINGWLWERGFDAQLLVDGGERDAARRLVLEPLRAGLAGAIGDYPYWDAVWLDGAAPDRRARA